MSMKAAFMSLGCKVNAYETEAMAEQMRAAGYEIVPFEPGADLYVINTCTVTNIADRKSRQMLHRAKEMNPDAVVAAVGCYVEDSREQIKKDEMIDLAIGNNEKSKLPEIFAAWFEKTGRAPEAEDERTAKSSISAVQEYEELQISNAGERTRAYVKIQDGCNQFCSYCMIPYVRGRVRSRKAEDILNEVERLSEAGYKEIVLTGIHISSYGLDFDYPGESRQTPDSSEASTNVRLLELIRAISEKRNIERIRLGSLEPGIMTDEFVEEIAKIPEICPQFHLSLQSGSDTVLQRMRRKYHIADYAGICERLREHFDHPAITTDIIVGFPGETEEEFEETKRFAEKIAFAKIHVFKYSARKGTKAAAMKDQIPEPVKKVRSAALIELDRKNRRAFAEHYLGTDVDVLLEETKVIRSKEYWTGHTKEAMDVLMASDIEEDFSGKILRLHVEKIEPDGTLIAGKG